MFACVPVHVYGHSDMCSTAIVMDFNVYRAALPTGGWHRLLAGYLKMEWAQRYNRGMSSRFSRMYGVYLGMGMYLQTK